MATDDPHRPPTLGEIMGLDKLDTPEGKVFQAYLRLDVRSEQTLRQLPLPDQYLWFIFRLDQEVQNGGIEQYFWNSSGDYVRETIEALKAIGALETYSSLKRAFDLFPSGGPSEQQTIRQEQMRQIIATSEKTVTHHLDDLIEFGWDANLFELLLEYRKGPV